MSPDQLTRIKEIQRLCKERGCPKSLAEKHHNQFVYRRWNPHPPTEFVEWWEPTNRDPVSGADVGGHPEARRQWSRKSKDGYALGTYGITAESAWNTEEYRREFDAWIEAGRPERAEAFVSVAMSLQEQRARMARIIAATGL